MAVSFTNDLKAIKTKNFAGFKEKSSFYPEIQAIFQHKKGII